MGNLFTNFETSDKDLTGFLTQSAKVEIGTMYNMTGEVYFQEKDSGWVPVKYDLKKYNRIDEK